MRFDNEVTVQAPVARVWEALLDLQRVAPCMPGAEVLQRTADDAYRVAVRVRLGPISLLYRGTVEIVERDPVAHGATMHARAQETRGQGTASAKVRMVLSEEGRGATRARLETDLQLSGRVASMGRAVIGEVSEQLIGEFARNLQAMLAGGEAQAEPAAPASQPQRPAAPGAQPQAPTAPASQPAAASGPRPALSATRLAAGAIAAGLRNPRLMATAAVALPLAGFVSGYALGRARR